MQYSDFNGKVFWGEGWFFFNPQHREKRLPKEEKNFFFIYFFFYTNCHKTIGQHILYLKTFKNYDLQIIPFTKY